MSRVGGSVAAVAAVAVAAVAAAVAVAGQTADERVSKEIGLSSIMNERVTYHRRRSMRRSMRSGDSCDDASRLHRRHRRWLWLCLRLCLCFCGRPLQKREQELEGDALRESDSGCVVGFVSGETTTRKRKKKRTRGRGRGKGQRETGTGAGEWVR